MREENRLLKEAVGSSKAKKGFNKTNSEQQDEPEQTDIDTESQASKPYKDGKKAKYMKYLDNGNRRDRDAV